MEYTNAPLVEATFTVGYLSDSFSSDERKKFADFLKNNEFSEQEECERCGHKCGQYERFKNRDGSVFTCVIPSGARIHRLTGYVWEKFKRDAIWLFDGFKEIADPKKVPKISMRYTNLIKKTEGEYRDHINLFPATQGGLENVPYESFRVALTSKTDDPKGVCTIDIGNVKSKDEPCILFEISIRSKGCEDIGTWCESAHERIREMFKRGITNAVHDKIR